MPISTILWSVIAKSALSKIGATIAQEVRDVGGGKLVAPREDADGNVIGLVQPA